MNPIYELRNSINGLFFCLILSISISNKVHAAQWGTVIVNKAVIFSDIEMKSMIGFIKKGKKVRVGEVARNKGRLLPIVINKRVAYIQVVDLNIGSDVKKLKSITSRYKERMDSSASESKRLAIYGLLFPIQFTADDQDLENSDLATTYYGGGLTGYYTNQKLGWTMKLSLETFRYTDSKDDLVISFYNVPVGFKFHSIHEKTYSFDFYYGFNLFPYIEYSVGSDLVLNGQGYGGFINAEYVTELSLRSNLHLEAGFEINRISNFGTDSNNDIANELGDALQGFIYGPKFSLKFSYDY